MDDKPADLGDRSTFMLEVLAESWVDAIGRGETDSAKALLQVCAAHLRNGQPIPTAAAEYLAACLEDIERAPQPWGVPLMRRKRGQKGADARMRDREIAMEYWVLTDVQGIKGTAAELDLAQRYGVTSNQVRHAWKNNRANIEAIDPQDYLDWLREQALDAMGE